ASFDSNTGALTGTPSRPDVGTTHGIVISVSDGELTASLPAFSLTVESVNEAPQAQALQAQLDEDSSIQVALKATDANGDVLSFELVSQPEHGRASITGSTLLYTPEANYHGEDSLLYLAKDAEASSEPAQVQLTVQSVNDKPVAQDDSYSLSKA